MPFNLRKCRCGLAMSAMAADNQGLSAALFLCSHCDGRPGEEASWVTECWRRKLAERGET